MVVTDRSASVPIAYYGIGFHGHGYWADGQVVTFERTIHSIVHPAVEFTLDGVDPFSQGPPTHLASSSRDSGRLEVAMNPCAKRCLLRVGTVRASIPIKPPSAWHGIEK